ncbi:MAG TPA: glycoside hydrolase family 3 N-terminal domain-containing protein [Clostridia bacterium]|nr:glycoside hydrolase family 3 N-terminal domain-containing protein [Clostridia bacterium]HQA96349.1 glycoside hydrolase family 3 N-terminal domain-containing protein [Clostridia bacterium]HQO56156.1 glycoside hydrolase family 3 N-terminal domain-containing protein [Clostridia bacterium]
MSKDFWKRCLCIAAAVLMAGAMTPGMAQSGGDEQPALNPRVKSTIEADGYRFIDLNGNGELDVYEDWRQDAQTRANDLVSQMTAREKIAQMQHPTYLPRADGSIPSYLEKWCKTEGVGMLLIRELNSVEAAATSMNTIQEFAEGSRLGIPVLVSMDSVHGLSYVTGATVTPHNLAMAATRNEELVVKLAEIAREEHIAIGVRMTLSPEADIASEPRWGRVMETFGEDPDLVTRMVTAQVIAFQNGADGLNTGSIVACMKHFPGAGPQMDGKDTSPIISSEEMMRIHLKPYYAALEANIASIMPYYSVPLALDMENSAIGSKATLQDLLRSEMGFEGIIQTDWGMIWAIQEALGTMTGEEVSDEEAILIGVTQSRVDGIGGESIRLIDYMEEYTVDGKIDEAILTAAAARIVKVKFEMGVFENPYCDVEHAVSFVGNEESQALSLQAAREAMTLLKNDGILPLDASATQTILVAGPRAGDMDSLVGGWSSSQKGLSIAEALAEYAGENTKVIYEADHLERIGQLAEEADLIIVSVGEPSYQHDPPWGYDTLEITPSQQEILEVAKASGKPIVTVMTGGRPYILTWCDENTNAVLAAYYPGSQGGIAIAETLYGINNPTGKTPVQFPRDMQSVNNQQGDVSFDLENPLYDYGWGLSYEE